MTIEQRGKWVLLGAILFSLLVHGAASVALALLPSPSEMLAVLQHRTIEFEMEDDELPLPAVQPEPEPEAPTPDEEVPPTPRDVTPPPPRDPATPPPPETPEPPAPLAEQVHDFSGQVLTTTGSGAGWATAVGSGQDTRGPIGNPVARTTGRDVAGSSAGVVGGTGTAPAAPAAINYTRRPSQPPGMGGHLQRFYPTGARARGVEGRARVMIRILADGALDVQRVVSESPPGEGFGQACMEALRRSPSWTSALDEAGEAVASPPRPFDCTFRQQ
jgi:TonB family protein